jgi:UDP-N-acetylglucosamine 1-carboxyvinyltransferase
MTRRFEMRASRLVGRSIFLDEASVTGTENAVMAAVLAHGGTTIVNAACEPHVQDLCRFLVSLGAHIDGIESNVLRIEGVTALSGGEWAIGPDHIEVASFVGLAAATGGEVVVEDVQADDLISIVPAFRKLGVHMEVSDSGVRVPAGQQLFVEDDFGGQIPKIESGIWPAFPADLTSIAVTVATQATGTILIFEKMFENRLFFVDKLVSMGARIILCDPHRVVVTGPATLYGERLESPDIRAGMAMLIAALAADGTSEEELLFPHAARMEAMLSVPAPRPAYLSRSLRDIRDWVIPRRNAGSTGSLLTVFPLKSLNAGQASIVGSLGF